MTYRITYPPRPQAPEPRVHDGYEWIYVLSGRLRLILGDQDLVLEPVQGRIKSDVGLARRGWVLFAVAAAAAESVGSKRKTTFLTAVAGKPRPELIRETDDPRGYACDLPRGYRIGQWQAVRIANKFVDLKIGYLKTKIVRSNIFYEMGFVKYHCAVVRDHLTILISSHAEISEEQMMIDNYDVGILGSSPHAGNETRLEIRTFLTDASLAFGVNAAPERQIFRKCRELAAITCTRFPRPPANRVEIVHLIKAIKYRLVLGLCYAVQTGIIASPFHVRGGEFLRQDLLQKRNILFH